jgi:hypothetical protein
LVLFKILIYIGSENYKLTKVCTCLLSFDPSSNRRKDKGFIINYM